MAFRYSSLSNGLVQADPSVAFTPQGFSEPARVRPQPQPIPASSGSFIDNVLNRPNRVPELQKHFQAPSDLPVFLRGKNDLFVFRTINVMSGLALGLVFLGIAQMSLGVGKKKN